MRGQVMLAVGALASALMVAQPAAAQGYYASPQQTQYEQQCGNARTGRTIGGAAIGAIAGAVLGNNVGGRGHQGDGTLLGAVLGGAAGAAIGRSTARCTTQPYQQGYNQPYQGTPYYQGQQQAPYQQPAPYGDDDQLYGGPYTPSSYQGGGSGYQGGGNCRWGEQVMRDPEGYEYRENVYMCRGRDGQWRPQRR